MENVDPFATCEMGDLEFDNGNYMEAKNLYLDSLDAANKSILLRYIANSKKGLGKTELHFNNRKIAEKYLNESLVIYRRLGNKNEIIEVQDLIINCIS